MASFEVMEMTPDSASIDETNNVPTLTVWILSVVGWTSNGTGERAKTCSRITMFLVIAIHAYVLIKHGLIRLWGVVVDGRSQHLALQWHFAASIHDILNPLASIAHLLFFHYATLSGKSKIRCIDSTSVNVLKRFNFLMVMFVLLPGLLLIPTFLCSQRYATLRERFLYGPEIVGDFFATAVPRYATMTLLFCDMQIPRHFLRYFCSSAPTKNYENIHASHKRLQLLADERNAVWSRFLVCALICDLVGLATLMWTDTLLILGEASLALHLYTFLWLLPMSVQVVAQLYPIAMFNHEVNRAPRELAKSHASESTLSAASLLSIAPPRLLFFGCIKVTPRLLCQAAVPISFIIVRFEVMHLLGMIMTSVNSWKKLACVPGDGADC